MLKLRRVDIERSEEVFQRIDRYVAEVVEKLNPRKVILFGSFAQGDFNEASDIDLVVIADFKESFLDRIRSLMELNRFGLPLEPIGYTPKEFEEMEKKGNLFIAEIIEKGRVLYP